MANPEIDPPVPEEADEATEEEEENNNKGGQRVRVRRKKIYKTLTAQLEFYFSDANLSKSKYLIDILEKEGPWLPTELFLKFNKIKSLLSEFFHTSEEDQEDNLRHLTSALTKITSSLLEVSPDGLKLRRRLPFKGPSPDEEERTLYVENLPVYSTQDSISQLFSQYGHVDYVSFPKYKESQTPKGFAFVEFANLESAQKALSAYGASIDFEKKDPSELQSIRSFQIEQKANLLNEKKAPEEKNEALNSGSAQEEEEDKSSAKSGKRKRKRKKKAPLESEEDLQLMTLTVMSKTTWRKLRNKYLNLQRKNASQAKQRFRKMREKEDRATESPVGTKEDAVPPPEGEEPKKGGEESLPFVPNTIVKVEVEHMVDKPKLYKSRIVEALSKPVKYVDVGIGNKKFHIRCLDEEQARQLIQLKDSLFSEDNTVSTLSLLSGEEEARYWSKIQKDRDDKRTGKVKVRPKKRRGRDKLQEKIDVAVNTRIVFFK